jgi:hypothetical protein
VPPWKRTASSPHCCHSGWVHSHEHTRVHFGERQRFFQSVFIRERTKPRKADGRIIAMWSEMDRLGGQGRTAAAKTL